MNTRRTRRNKNPVMENEDSQESNKETQSRKRIKSKFDSSDDENSRPAENDLEEAPKSNESKRSKFDTDEQQSSDDEKLQNISTESRKRRIPQLKDDDGSSSDSSVGDYLKNADEIDLNSTFFQFENENPPDFGEIEKKMFSGVHVHSLSDSEESDFKDNTETLKTPEIQIESSQNTPTCSNFTQLNKYNEKLEEAKACVQNYEKKIVKHQKKVRKDKNIEDINHLLSIGEKQNRESIDSSHILTSEDEDWEEIQESVKEEPKIPKEGVQITVELPGAVRRKKKSEDLMAAIKRRINRVKKENQVFVHKVHLLCWIAHGNFLNNILNNETLLAQALSLLPSEQCYPPKNADISYLEQIVRWYGKMMKLSESEPDNQTPVKDQLNVQINKKQANSKRNFILLFIIILRSLGLQCRLVLSFQCLPLRPSSSELCSLSTKDNKSNDKTEKSKSSTSKDTKNKKIKSKAPTVNTSIKHKLDRKLNESIKNKLNSSKSLDTSKIKKSVPKSSKIDKHIKTESNNENISEKLKKGTSKKITLKEKLDINSEKIIPEQSTSKAIPSSSGTKSEEQIDNRIKNENNKNNWKISKNGVFKKLSLKEKLDKNTEKITLDQSTSKTKHHNSETTSTESTILKSKNFKTSLKEKLDKNLSLNKKDVKPKKSVRISQVDGADDSPPRKTKSKSKQTLSDKLKKNLSDSDSEFQISERQKRKSRSKPVKYFESPLTAESDFQANRETPSPTKSVSKSPKDINHNKSKPSTSKDVRNDIISLIKGSMVEHRHKEQLKNSRKKSKDSDYDSDFMPESSSKGKSKKKFNTSDELMSKIKVNTKVKRRIPPKSEIDRRVLSSDDDILEIKKKGNDVWLEVFLEEEEKWISVDLIKGQVHCVSELYNRASHPMSYVIAWNNNLSIKDISARYCPNWNTVTRKLRVDLVWWHETLKPFIGTKTRRDKEEDEDLARQQLDKPLPTTINEYKNHPLYALKRHLLKFEAIYPPDALILGFVRKEPVYARECVHTLHSREIWVKQAKVVKPKQEPYKIVKARPKYDRLTGNTITDLPLELFGIWQVDEYVPPTAENGVVPRNAFGNVELFKTCMLPKKTVHLQLPGLNRIARKLRIDCAPAVVGFDFHCGGSHPTFDGFVVCEEFKDTLIAAWEQDRDETAKREQEKYEKRVYGNWRKLIKGLLIRERLKARYDFGNMGVTKKVKPSKAKKSKTDG